MQAREYVRQEQLSEGSKARRNVKDCYSWTEEHEGESGKRNWADKKGPEYVVF